MNLSNSSVRILLFLSLFIGISAAYSQPQRPQNVILMIGDGMGLTQVTGGMTIKKTPLTLESFPFTGFAKTFSADNYITDSAAAGTALSSGIKTYNGAIGVDINKKPIPSILSESEAKGLATGMVVTSYVTHATPAAFIAHQVDRNMYEEIADDFLKTDIDVFIGGGRDHFELRKDKRNLSDILRKNGYQVAYTLAEAQKVTQGKLAGLLAKEHMPPVAERGDMLPKSVAVALNILSKNRKGFFLMVEGSQIDFEGHNNNGPAILAEMVDFDDAIAVAYAYAQKNRNTLIVVTADHETGGMALKAGNIAKKTATAIFAQTNHTGTMVPVFAFGPGAEMFSGIMDNTDIPKKIRVALGIGQ